MANRVPPKPAQPGWRQSSSAAPGWSLCPFLMSPHPAAGLARGAHEVRDPSATPVPDPWCAAQPPRQQLQGPSGPSGHGSALPGSLAGSLVVPGATLPALQPLSSSSQRLPGHLETPSSTQYCYCAKWELYSLLWLGFFRYFFSESAKEAALKMGQIWIILFFPSRICNILIAFCPDISSVSLYSSEPRRHQQQ